MTKRSVSCVDTKYKREELVTNRHQATRADSDDDNDGVSDSSDGFPYVLACFKGTPDPSFNK
ncbi:hypothetical protein [Glaciecola sp. KUL10]|uniref:hypothetical protein n=1 Tax=Glaciecola sp. (strain KUL10) TaxID=2161813 RepID=UPI0011B54A51|nr:hypothetical protein [Glaciecola sp. KUL10]